MAGPGPLVALENRAKLSSTITRILGQNPSLFTLQGTNTYFIQPDSPSAPIILVDTTMPTTADAWVAQVIAHLDALDAEASAAGDVERAHIAHLIITHRHIDHVGGFIPLFSALRARGAKPVTVWKMSNPDEAELATSPRDHDVYSTDGAIGARLAEVEEMVVKCPSGGLVHALKDGTHVGIEHPAGNVGVTAVHTPGHTADSVALLADGPERALVTGDTILGQGTTIFQDFAAYMKSLHKILALDPTILYPAHGPHIVGVDACRAHIGSYIKHRQEREDTIVRALQLLRREPGTLGEKLDAIRAKAAETVRSGEATDKGRVPGAGADAAAAAAKAALESQPITHAFPTEGDGAMAATVPLLVRLVYATGHEGLIYAASRTVGSHLDKLEAEGRARRIKAALPTIKDWAVEEIPQDAEGWEWVGEMPEGNGAANGNGTANGNANGQTEASL